MKIQSLTANLMVANVRKSVEFYQDFLGFEIIQTNPTEGEWEWAMISNGDAFLMLQEISSLKKEIPSMEFSAVKSMLLYIKVEDIDLCYEALKPSVKILKEKYETFYGSEEFVIEDIDGYPIVLAE